MEINICNLASGNTRFIDTVDDVSATKNVNVQLTYWLSAIDIVYNINDQGFDIGKGLVVINLIANSLLTLGARHVQVIPGKGVPTFEQMYEGNRNPKFNLKSADHELYERLRKLVHLQNNTTKYLSQEHNEEVRSFNVDELTSHLKTAQDVWKWVLNNFYKQEEAEAIIANYFDNPL